MKTTEITILQLMTNQIVLDTGILDPNSFCEEFSHALECLNFQFLQFILFHVDVFTHSVCSNMCSTFYHKATGTIVDSKYYRITVTSSQTTATRFVFKQFAWADNNGNIKVLHRLWCVAISRDIFWILRKRTQNNQWTMELRRTQRAAPK